MKRDNDEMTKRTKARMVREKEALICPAAILLIIQEAKDHARGDIIPVKCKRPNT